MSESCPKCGAEVREEGWKYRRFECLTLEFDELPTVPPPCPAELRESAECLRRQRAQRDERIATLEAELAEAQAHNAAVKVIVAAAIECEMCPGYIIEDDGWHPCSVCAQKLREAIRTLPAEERSWWEEA